MGEARVVEFCARVNPRSMNLVMTNVHVVTVTWGLNFLSKKC